MAVKKIEINAFIELSKQFPVIDVRSPGEFAHAHIPGAINLPLFSDEERRIVGTAYKHQGKQAAIKIGLEFYGPKMRLMVEEVEALLEKWPRKADVETYNCVLVHCWRGGMRSAAIAWLLDLYGFTVYQLEGGYKKFRHLVLETFRLPVNYHILGGYTGSGKTAILQEMKRRAMPVIDLESLANHKGSAFGMVGPQPSQEMFENTLAIGIVHALSMPTSEARQIIWLEDESQRIGSVNIPAGLWEQMRKAPVYFLEIPFEERLRRISVEYSHFSKEDLLAAIRRIQKRLGGQETKNAISFLSQDDLPGCFSILLAYYDRLYLKGYNARPCIHSNKLAFQSGTTDPLVNARLVSNLFKNEHPEITSPL